MTRRPWLRAAAYDVRNLALHLATAPLRALAERAERIDTRLCDRWNVTEDQS